MSAVPPTASRRRAGDALFGDVALEQPLPTLRSVGILAGLAAILARAQPRGDLGTPSVMICSSSACSVDDLRVMTFDRSGEG